MMNSITDKKVFKSLVDVRRNYTVRNPGIIKPWYYHIPGMPRFPELLQILYHLVIPLSR